MKGIANIVKTIKKQVLVSRLSVTSLAIFMALCLGVGPLTGSAHAAIALRTNVVATAGNSSSASTVTLTITKPGNVVQGDVMILEIAQSTDGNAPGLNVGTTGFNVIKGASATGRRVTVLYKVAGVSEPGSYSFTLTTDAWQSSIAGLAVFSGVDNTTPLDVATNNLPALTSANSSTCSATATNTVTANAVKVMCGLATGGSSARTWNTWTPAGLAEIIDSQYRNASGTSAGYVSLGMAWTNQPIAGTTGSGSCTLSGSQQNFGMWVLLRPASSAVADATNSALSASPASVPADGVTTSTVTVVLKDAASNTVPGKAVTLSSSRGATDTITPASGVSDGSGVVAFAVKSSTVGSSTYTATDTTDSVTLTQTVTVTFYASSAKDIATFGANYAGSSAVINTNAATVAWTVPFGTAVTNLAPAYTVSPAATGSPPSGTTRDFTTPQTYTITAQDSSTKDYTVTVSVAPASSAKDILTFGTNYTSSATIDTNAATVTWNLPVGTLVTALSPAYTVSLFASGSPVSGATRNFTTPQTYTITAQDGSAKIYTVTAVVAVGPQTYGIALSTDVAQEFSPLNRSGHPIVTGLSNYVNSTAPRALLATALKAPWNANVGSQTMMCSDCHDSTTTNYAASVAQGPHGSANQYLLRGPNANNWPNTTSFASSWCANCHSNNVGNSIHTRSEHMNSMCYGCHIVIPHGGKVSRLIGDRDTMPARYAWNNILANMQISEFRKTNAASYVESGNCSAPCDASRHPSFTGSENW